MSTPTLAMQDHQHPQGGTERYFLCGVPVDSIRVSDLVERCVQLSGGSTPAHICYVNAHVHNLCRADKKLNTVLVDANVCYPDGMSIVWAARALGWRLPERMTGVDFFPTVIGRMRDLGRRVFLLGGRPGVAELCAERLGQLQPGFRPVGTQHGYADLASATVLQAIRSARPDLLVVGLGTPLQERWINAHAGNLGVPLTWAVGALFDYFAGVERRAPRWMAENGLEWAFRLAMQPRKMALRYLWGNPRFVASVLAERTKFR
jgi:N-acetylglucosaminyldiphosphoundecaprenol N-acetyl-beta-D-mannosaminyltransferase